MHDMISQEEADSLLGLEKFTVGNSRVQLPDLGGKLSIDLISADKRERFNFDVNRSYLSLAKLTLQTRSRSVVILARLDLAGAPHRNPDDTELPCPHIHLYRAGYGDKWAFLVPQVSFRNLNDRWQTLSDFMEFCRIVEPPEFDKGLFT